LRGISAWQHPVIVLKDVPYSDLQVCKREILGLLIMSKKKCPDFLNFNFKKYPSGKTTFSI
jgi:hypothetical protein